MRCKLDDRILPGCKSSRLSSKCDEQSSAKGILALGKGILANCLIALIAVCSCLDATGRAQSSENEHYLLVEYQSVTEEGLISLDDYFENAYLPALERIGLDRIGVFLTQQKEASEPNDQQMEPRLPSMYLLIPLPSSASISQIQERLSTDAEYQQAAKAFLERDVASPGYQRQRTEYLVAFDCMPQLHVPAQSLAKSERLFELRTYESATEGKAIRKVEMFNDGEVPIFLECEIQPVFLGQALVGDRCPNLSYMTVYDSSEARDAAWERFRNAESWKTFSANPRYAKTVSRIYITDLVPRTYSRL